MKEFIKLVRMREITLKIYSILISKIIPANTFTISNGSRFNYSIALI